MRENDRFQVFLQVYNERYTHSTAVIDKMNKTFSIIVPGILSGHFVNTPWSSSQVYAEYTYEIT